MRNGVREQTELRSDLNRLIYRTCSARLLLSTCGDILGSDIN